MIALPVVFSAASVVMLLVLAWRSAGQIGLDRWLLPALGLAGYRGSLVEGKGMGRRHGE
jgi:hypothetical protein